MHFLPFIWFLNKEKKNAPPPPPPPPNIVCVREIFGSKVLRAMNQELFGNLFIGTVSFTRYSYSRRDSNQSEATLIDFMLCYTIETCQ